MTPDPNFWETCAGAEPANYLVRCELGPEHWFETRDELAVTCGEHSTEQPPNTSSSNSL